MSAALIWIFIPFFFALILFALAKYPRAAMLTGVIFSLALTIAAFAIEIDRTYIWGGVPLKVQSEMSLLGRSLVIENADRGMIFLLFLLCTFWMLMGSIFDPIPSYAGFAMLVMAFLIASIAVEPFLYAALFIEMAVMVSLPILIRLVGQKGRGEVLYLVFMTLAVPFLLLAGWAADGVEADPLDTLMYSRALLMLAIGFSMLLSSFPFFTWIPKLSQQIRPSRLFFIMSVLPVALFLLFSEFLSSYAWIRDSALLSTALNLSGLLLIVISGIWVAFQDDLGRMFGYAVILENGFTFLALRIENGGDLTALVFVFFTRLLGFAVWGLGSSVLHKYDIGFSFESLKGIMRRHPVPAIAILVAYFSLSGLPLLAGFPSRLFLIQSMGTEYGVREGLWILVGQMGFIIGGLRLFSIMLREGDAQTSRRSLAWFENLMLGVGIMVLLFVGIVPAPFYQGLVNFLGGMQFIPY